MWSCVVKFDMHKAYDRVVNIFLENMICKLGFAGRWIELMMTCVRSARYQVRFNSKDTDMFVPTRGLLGIRTLLICFFYVWKVYLVFC
jgi:hypothetical protein